MSKKIHFYINGVDKKITLEDKGNESTINEVVDSLDKMMTSTKNAIITVGDDTLIVSPGSINSIHIQVLDSVPKKRKSITDENTSTQYVQPSIFDELDMPVTSKSEDVVVDINADLEYDTEIDDDIEIEEFDEYMDNEDDPIDDVDVGVSEELLK